MCQFFVEGNKMANVDIAIILLQQDILPDLISVPSLADAMWKIRYTDL